MDHVNRFLERFQALACNFEWSQAGISIYSYKKTLYYDPISAYVKITKGIYLDRYDTQFADKYLCMPKATFMIVHRALYYPDKDNLKVIAFRDAILAACKLLK